MNRKKEMKQLSDPFFRVKLLLIIKSLNKITSISGSKSRIEKRICS